MEEARKKYDVCAFDIETIPDVEGLRNLYGFPSNLSDGKVVENAHKLRKEETGNDSEFLQPFLQKIVAISCVLRNSSGSGDKLEIHSFWGKEKNESQLIKGFFHLIDTYTPKIVSWNGSGFDIPVLNHRSMINCVTTGGRLWNREGRDSYLNRYHDKHLDLMDLLSMYQYSNRCKLDDFAKMCGLPGKTSVAGNEIWNVWKEGRLQEIKEHCEVDALLTYLLFVKFQQLRGELNFEGEVSIVKEYLQKIEGDHWKEFLNDMLKIDGGHSKELVETTQDKTEKPLSKTVRRRKDGKTISEKTTNGNIK